MSLVFFSCAYKEDRDSVEYFKYLITNAEIVISLDPPSERIEGKPAVNSAKLERHLRHCDGMISVLHRTKDGVSPYVLYEIGLAQRSGKPLLVFVEDSLPDGIVSAGILQSRFSRRSFLREMREHRHVLSILKDYIGRDSPRYLPLASRKTCLLVGTSILSNDQRGALLAKVDEAGYTPVDLFSILGDSGSSPVYFDESIQHLIATATLAVCIVDDQLSQSQFLFGAVRWAFVPVISLSINESYGFDQKKSSSLQPRIVDFRNPALFDDVLMHEFNLFEGDFVDIFDHVGIQEYMDRLVRAPTRNGHFEPGTRDMFRDLVLGPTLSFDRSQIGSIGKDSSGSVFDSVRSESDRVRVESHQGTPLGGTSTGASPSSLSRSRSSGSKEESMSDDSKPGLEGSTTDISVNNSQVGAIGTRSEGKVTGPLIVNHDSVKQVNVDSLRAALTELYAALGQANLPPDKLIAAQTAIGNAISEDLKDGKVDPEGLVSHVEQVGKTLQEANVVVTEGTSLWNSVQKAAPLIGPIVGGARVVLGLFGVPA